MKRIPESQYGGVLVLVAVSITMFCVMLAFALDYGRVILTKSELQAAADSAALAGAAKLVDEGVAEGDDSQDDNIIAARDYAEDFALQNAAGNQFLALDRNDANEVNGGVVVGYIDDPLDLGDEMVTDDVSLYNSVEVQTSLSHTMNSPLGLFLGGITGVQELEMSAKATATLEDRVVGFTPSESENLMMLPFTAYQGNWNTATDGSGDTDSYKVVNGVVSSGKDGIPELTLYPFKSGIAISGITGNVGALFICGSAGVNVASVKTQITYGITKSNVEALGELELRKNSSGVYRQWIPGESWMDSSWMTALGSIKGKPRIMALFNSAVNSSRKPTTFNDLKTPDLRPGEEPEVCCGINQHYQTVEYKAVTIVYTYWNSSDSTKTKWIVQPSEVVTETAKVNPAMPHSGLVYSLSLTR